MRWFGRWNVLSREELRSRCFLILSMCSSRRPVHSHTHAHTYTYFHHTSTYARTHVHMGPAGISQNRFGDYFRQHRCRWNFFKLHPTIRHSFSGFLTSFVCLSTGNSLWYFQVGDGRKQLNRNVCGVTPIYVWIFRRRARSL